MPLPFPVRTRRGPDKALPYAACLALGCDTTALVGGHPLAGRERCGPRAARADLFQDRHWALTPSPETSESTLNRALELGPAYSKHVGRGI